MKQDIKSNNVLAVEVPAASNAAATYNGTGVDHAKAPSASYHINCGDVGAAGTLDAKLQYSDDAVTWTDYPANDPMGNDSAITQITAAGEAQLNVVNPRGRYSRTVSTVAANAVVFGITSIAGPLRHIDV